MNTGKEYVGSANKYDLEKTTDQDCPKWFFEKSGSTFIKLSCFLFPNHIKITLF